MCMHNKTTYDARARFPHAVTMKPPRAALSAAAAAAAAEKKATTARWHHLRAAGAR